jgi:protein TonB
VDWGADPAGFEPGATRPQPAGDPSSWFGLRDFGLSTATQSAGFTAVFRLAVDAQGRASDCALIESAGNVDLTGACRALTGRARYEPARDAQGNPIRSIAVYVADYRMEIDYRITG